MTGSTAGTPVAPPTPESRAAGGFTWGGLSAVASVLIQLAITAAMARLLQPSDFGLLAMCAVALRLFSYFSQLGLGAALIQKPTLGDQDVRCALGLTWVACSAAAAGVAASAPLLGWFFRSTEVATLLWALAPNLLVLGLGAVPTALLRRGLRFRGLAVVETASYAFGYGAIGVTAAALGAGRWSLVAATYGQSLLALLGGWALTRHPLRPSLRGDRSALVRYGVPHSFVSFMEFLSANLDATLIGRLLGDAPLGLYNRALLLTNQPVERVAGILTRVLFPLLAAVQQERRRVAALFLLAVAFIGTFGGAVSLGLSAAAADAVGALLGPRWADAAPVVEILALSVPFMFMSNVAGVLCDALALLRFKLMVQGFGLALIAVLVLALLPSGMRGVAWAIVIGEALRFTVYLVFLSRELHCPRGELARVLAGVGTASALSWAACAGAAWVGRRGALPPAPALGLELVAGLVALVAGGAFALRLLDGTEVTRVAEAVVPGWRRLRARLGTAEAGA